MNLIAWLVAGGVIGWLASLLVKANARLRVLDVLVGAVGAFIGGYLFAPLIGGVATHQQGFGVTAFVISVMGAVLLLVVTRMLRHAATQ